MAHRPLWHLTLGGVFERFPRLKFVLSEQGCAWVPSTLAQMDGLHMAASFGRTGELKLEAGALPLKPSEYFERNVWIGASFPQLRDTGAMRKIGLHKVMWGSDYPHHEGVSPHSREHLRRSFHDWSTEELDQVLTTTACDVYGFDVDRLAPRAIEVGPTAAEIRVPLDRIPEGATSPAFYM
jgi:predicted TIM-barrel fold metal-dependent hydrolase